MINDIMQNPEDYSIVSRLASYMHYDNVDVFPVDVTDFVFNVNMHLYEVKNGNVDYKSNNVIPFNFKTKKRMTYGDILESCSLFKTGNYVDVGSSLINPMTGLSADWYKGNTSAKVSYADALESLKTEFLGGFLDDELSVYWDHSEDY